MQTSSGQGHPPPDEDPRSESGEPFNPSQLLWRIWRFLRGDRRPSRRASAKGTAARPRSRIPVIALRLLPVWIGLVIVIIAAPTLPGILLRGAVQLTRGIFGPDEIIIVVGQPGATPEPEPLWDLQISPVFSGEVQFWANDIATWSLTYEIPADFIATIMQIESCGDPSVVSSAGANGLFQVMPFHFEQGEEVLNPQNNARAGLSFMASLLELSDGEVDGALAGYNAGGWAVDAPPEAWPDETQRYVYWGTGIYSEAVSGAQESARLNEWLSNGGYVLCQRAASRLGVQVTPYPTPALGG